MLNFILRQGEITMMEQGCSAPTEDQLGLPLALPKSYLHEEA